MTTAPVAPTVAHMLEQLAPAIALAKFPPRANRTFQIQTEDLTFRVGHQGPTHTFELYDSPSGKAKFEGVRIGVKTEAGKDLGELVLNAEAEAALVLFDTPAKTILILTFAPPAA